MNLFRSKTSLFYEIEVNCSAISLQYRISGSQPFFSSVAFGQFFVYQVPLDCNHKHNN